MPIKFECSCGKRIEAPDAAAGKKGKCPRCGREVLVPTAAPRTPTSRVPVVAPTVPCASCGREVPASSFDCPFCKAPVVLGNEIAAAPKGRPAPPRPVPTPAYSADATIVDMPIPAAPAADLNATIMDEVFVPPQRSAAAPPSRPPAPPPQRQAAPPPQRPAAPPVVVPRKPTQAVPAPPRKPTQSVPSPVRPLAHAEMPPPTQMPVARNPTPAGGVLRPASLPSRQGAAPAPVMPAVTAPLPTFQPPPRPPAPLPPPQPVTEDEFPLPPPPAPSRDHDEEGTSRDHRPPTAAPASGTAVLPRSAACYLCWLTATGGCMTQLATMVLLFHVQIGTFPPLGGADLVRFEFHKLALATLVTSPMALILGLIGQFSTRDNEAHAMGRTWAEAGLLLAFLSLLFGAVFWFFPGFVDFLPKSWK